MEAVYAVVRFFVTGGPFMYPILIVFAVGTAVTAIVSSQRPNFRNIRIRSTGRLIRRRGLRFEIGMNPLLYGAPLYPTNQRDPTNDQEVCSNSALPDVHCSTCERSG